MLFVQSLHDSFAAITLAVMQLWHQRGLKPGDYQGSMEQSLDFLGNLSYYFPYMTERPQIYLTKNHC